MNIQSRGNAANMWTCSRREWLRTAIATGMSGGAALALNRQRLTAAESDQALIAITLDLEMSANFPTRETTHWNFEKGNLNDETKQYSVEAARRVKAAGGLLHFFAVGRVFEHPSVDWLKEILQEGHPVGNHTYDHINVTATTVKDLQFRFQRAPWLLRDLTVADAIRDNILLMSKAMTSRMGVPPVGFRTPGGFANGLREQPQIRAMLQDLGFDWVSSLYPPHLNTEPMQEPSATVLDSIVAAQVNAQPFVYPDGLIEIPMSPISDIGAFRTGQWKLDWFLKSIRQSLEWAIDNHAVFDFLAHPSCLYVVDPEFKSIQLICETVRKAGKRASIVDLTTVAARVKSRK
ncbi:polysaccharide deacetylase family protein [Schlesneria paludicola]|uniref:polysaccharide deacetylase family protein n=1 Tax=Schlesneria paludicola TaxID=360056 RepID=UPI00029AD3E5|nr:polysaccharide deacetylase family protein [Schlesneria paludicola]